MSFTLARFETTSFSRFRTTRNDEGIYRIHFEYFFFAQCIFVCMFFFHSSCISHLVSQCALCSSHAIIHSSRVSRLQLHFTLSVTLTQCWMATIWCDMDNMTIEIRLLPLRHITYQQLRVAAANTENYYKTNFNVARQQQKQPPIRARAHEKWAEKLKEKK